MNLPPPSSDWLSAICGRLHQQWPTVDQATLSDVALDLWCDERLRAMRPDLAAEEWLRPVARQ